MSDPVLIALLTITVPSLVVQILTYLNGRKIHTLVNSQYGEDLLIGMVSARNLALSHPSDANYKRLADIAEQKYNNHQAKQNLIDNK